MDSNAGEFVGEERAEDWMQRVAVGEIVKIKGEELEVMAIDKRTIVLKLLSAEDRFQERLSAIGTAVTADAEDLAAAAVECERQRKKMLRYQR